jgi:hypothetical protein
MPKLNVHKVERFVAACGGWGKNISKEFAIIRAQNLK